MHERAFLEGEQRLAVVAFLVLRIASLTVWPVNGFFSSAVAVGMPLMLSRRSTDCSCLSLKRTWRVMVRRLEAYCLAVSGLSAVAGAKYARRKVWPKKSRPWRRTFRVP
jgi:hypothetical protein